jgi:hypothetical protein
LAVASPNHLKLLFTKESGQKARRSVPDEGQALLRVENKAKSAISIWTVIAMTSLKVTMEISKL